MRLLRLLGGFFELFFHRDNYIYIYIYIYMYIYIKESIEILLAPKMGTYKILVFNFQF